MLEQTKARRHAAGTLASALPPEQCQFAVVLLAGESGRELASTPVGAAHLLDLQYEVWRDDCLRKGQPGALFENLQFRLEAEYADGSPTRCAGIRLRGRAPDGRVFERQFGTEVFADVAAQARSRLINDKALKLDDVVSYEVRATQQEALAAAQAGSASDEFTLESDPVPLEHLRQPLAPLLEQSREVGQTDDCFSVFFTERALELAEQFARRGAALNTPIETGGVLMGPLCACPESGEFFLVVVHVMEVQDAEESTFSLSYTGKSWARIQTILQAMQSQPAAKTFRILGQCHGHNFPPDGGAPPCEACATQKDCPRRSDAASVDDRIWTQAAFSRAPWALCHIFGTNARGDNVQSLFTLKNNQLQPRGFHVIPDFEPARMDQNDSHQ